MRDLFTHYKDGHLLRAGGIDDQPVAYLRAMRGMRAAFNKAETERMDQIRSESKKR